MRPGPGAIGPRLLAALATGDDVEASRLLRALVDVASTDSYSTDRLPPGIRTPKHFARVCRSGIVAGAAQDGARGPWACSREAWNAARRRTPKLVPPKLRLVVSDDDIVAASLRGLRGGQ